MNNLLEQGRALYKRGEYQKAIEVFDRAIGKATSVQLLDNRAACYEKLGELSSALKDAKKAIQLHREDATGYLRAGKVLVKMHKEPVALEIYTHGLKCIKHVGQGYELLRKSHKDLMDKLSPPKSVDPLTVLPRELAELVLEYLSFRQRINACMVTKGWAHFIRSSPNLWTHLDLTGARKKVPKKFVSRAINVARTKLTTATLNNLYDFDKTVASLAKACPLEVLTILKCGLIGPSLTDAMSNARHLKRLKLGKGSELQAFQLQHLLKAVSGQIEAFDCILRSGGIATIDEARCHNLRTLSFAFSSNHGLTSLLANISKALPALRSLTLTQTETTAASRTGMHMDLDKCSQLEHLDISSTFTSTSLLTLPPSLTVLRLNPLVATTAHMFFRAMKLQIQQPYYLPKLKELIIDSLHVTQSEISDYFLATSQQQAIPSDTPPSGSELRRLSASVGETSFFLAWLRDHPRLRKVEQLSLTESYGCNDESMDLLDGFFEQLRVLNLSGTEVTGVGVKEALKLPRLQHLIVNNCRHIGVDAIDWARSQGMRVDHRMSDDSGEGRQVRY